MAVLTGCRLRPPPAGTLADQIHAQSGPQAAVQLQVFITGATCYSLRAQLSFPAAYAQPHPWPLCVRSCRRRGTKCQGSTGASGSARLEGVMQLRLQHAGASALGAHHSNPFCHPPCRLLLGLHRSTTQPPVKTK